MEPSDIARLDYFCPADPEGRWRTILLLEAVTNIGRLEDGEPGLPLAGASISRKHACVRREESGGSMRYSLVNTRGRAGVRLYERLLQPGEQQALQHGYIFQIPGLLPAADADHWLIRFRVDDKQTTCLAFELCPPCTIRIFGQIMDFTPQEYALLAYLHERKDRLCLYHEIIATLWATELAPQQGALTPAEHAHAKADLFSIRRETLDVLLAKVRGKIREASGGMMFIETVRGLGLCLRINGSGNGRDR